MKLCKKCGCVKQKEEFSKNSRSKDGLQDRCKICHYAAVRASTLKNPDAKRKNRAKHMEKELVKNREYKANNKLKISESNRRYRSENQLQVKAAKSVYKALRRARLTGSGGSFSRHDVASLLEKQKDSCIVCKKRLNGKYHVDHIEPIAKGGRNDRTNIQILCPTCNLEKSSRDPIEFMQSRNYLL